MRFCGGGKQSGYKINNLLMQQQYSTINYCVEYPTHNSTHCKIPRNKPNRATPKIGYIYICKEHLQIN